MRIQILTIFPEMCEPILAGSILGRAQVKKLAVLEAVDLRLFAQDKHRTTDAPPYGGGPGMVMKIEPIHRALAALRGEQTRVIFLSPQGARLTHAKAKALSLESHLILLCGHYEGVDQRVSDHLVDEEVSIGDYVLTSGVLPALVLTDAIVRLIPGVLGDDESAVQESFATGSLDHPHYTRPETFQDWKVPEILLSGNHAAIGKWRAQQALEKTRAVRPDML